MTDWGMGRSGVSVSSPRPMSVSTISSRARNPSRIAPSSSASQTSAGWPRAIMVRLGLWTTRWATASACSLFSPCIE